MGATVPDHAEDIAVQWTVSAASKHLFNLATNTEYVATLEKMAKRYGAKGALQAVIEEASRARGGQDDLNACRRCSFCHALRPPPSDVVPPRTI